MTKAQGFTLIELITVVVILSIISVIGSHFVASTTASYNRTQQRSKLINGSRQALERMTRQLRVALPNSVRLTNGGICLEFLPIVSGGNYLDPVPDAANGAAASSSITTAPHSVNFGTANFVAIGAVNDAEVFGGTRVSLANLNTRSPTSLTLSVAKVWQRNSLTRRFFLVDNPEAFCISGGQLRFYGNQNISVADVDLSSSFDLLAKNAVIGPSPFVLSPGTEDRNAKVSINIGFVSGGEQVDFAQEVSVRNVP